MPIDTAPSTHILPEIAVAHADAQDRPTAFPSNCPRSGASLVTAVNYPAVNYRRSATYACGATYAHKPQIQNHTEKWWGACPVIKARQDRQP